MLHPPGSHVGVKLLWHRRQLNDTSHVPAKSKWKWTRILGLLKNLYFMMTSSNGNIFRVTGEFSLQRPVTRSFDVFCDLRPNKRLSKQSWGWWFETPSRSLWRHCNVACWILCAVMVIPSLNAAPLMQIYTHKRLLHWRWSDVLALLMLSILYVIVVYIPISGSMPWTIITWQPREAIPKCLAPWRRVQSILIC